MLKIQEFISCFDTMHEAATYLHRNVGINMVPHRILKGKVTVYTFRLMPRADTNNPLVRETNCLVIDNNNNLLAKAWDIPLLAEDADNIPSEFRLGNHNYIMEIPDGETVVVYNIDGKWCIATDNTPDGKKYISEVPGHTYGAEIKRMWAEQSNKAWYTPFKDVSPMLCFVFKYVDPYRDSIMPHIAKDIYLMAIINLVDGKEMTPDKVQNLAMNMSFSMPNRSEINGLVSLTGSLNRIRALSPGVMVKDEYNHYMVVPNPIYRAVINARVSGDRVNPTHMANIIQACRDKGDMLAVGAAYENFDKMLRLLWSSRVKLWKELSVLWNAANGKDLKEFAGIVQHHPLNFLLFMYKNREINSLKDAIANIKPGKLADFAKNKSVKEFELALRDLKYQKLGGMLDVIQKQKRKCGEETIQRRSCGGDDGCIPYTQEGD